MPSTHGTDGFECQLTFDSSNTWGELTMTTETTTETTTLTETERNRQVAYLLQSAGIISMFNPTPTPTDNPNDTYGPYRYGLCDMNVSGVYNPATNRYETPVIFQANTTIEINRRAHGMLTAWVEEYAKTGNDPDNYGRHTAGYAPQLMRVDFTTYNPYVHHETRVLSLGILSGSNMAGHLSSERRFRGTIEKLTRLDKFDDSPNVAKRLASSILDYLTYVTCRNVLDIRGSHPRMETDGTMSYYPLARVFQPARDNSPTETRNRIAGKPVRMLRQMLPTLATLTPDDGVTERAWEIVGLALAAIANPDESTSYVMVRGDDIARYYHESNYGEVAWSSCMSYVRSDVLAIYTDNPDRVGLLVKTNEDDQTLARAIVWTSDDGEILIDRIYADDETDRMRMLNHAQDIHSAIPTSQAQGYPTITLTNFDYDQYPYMDTFKYLCMETGRLSQDPDSFDGHYRELCSTGGSYEDRGIESTYTVRMERSVMQYVYVTVTASSADDAADIARSEYRYSAHEYETPEIDDDSGDSWEVDYNSIETDD